MTDLVSDPVSDADLDLPSPIRALHSLRGSAADAAQLAMALMGPEWSVLRHETYDGHLLLLLHGPDGEAWFSLHGAADGVHLGCLSEDRFAEMGAFETLSAAFAAAHAAVTAARLKKTDTRRLARALHSIIGGSMIAWGVIREGTAEKWMLADVDTLLAPLIVKRPARNKRPATRKRRPA